MKRNGRLMEGIAEGNNLRLAFWKAAKGKRGKADCLAFRERLDENLARLRGDILSGDVGVGNYHYFKVRDPKERLICAATFRSVLPPAQPCCRMAVGLTRQPSRPRHSISARQKVRFPCRVLVVESGSAKAPGFSFEVPQSLHRFRTSSRTKWRRMIPGACAGSS